MYKKLDRTADYAKMQEDVLAFWQKNGIKKKVLKMNEGSGKLFSFYEGPPTANGKPHAGHVLTRSLKDVYTRFAAMNGSYVPRKGGWDTHGLPVEISVEKALNISGKHDIENFGVEAFINECKKNVWLCIDKWKEFSEMVGYSLDLDEDCYNPYENKYIESVWWSLDELNKKGLLYKGYKILPSCPNCQTALSSQEVAQGYKDKTDITVVVKFWCDELDANFLAWTTTPWTLFSNVALCVNANEKYVMVKTADGVKYILAAALAPKHFKENEYEIVQEFVGSDLVGKSYIPLFDYFKDNVGTGFKIVSADFVTLDEGTGIVHIAPAYGEDDNNVGKVWNLPFAQLVNHRGLFSDECGEYAGKYIFDENENIVFDIIKQNKAFSKAKHTHSYPHCWRCKTPLIYYARDAWFVKTTAYKEDLIRVNNEINWFPKSFKDGRMGNFLKNNVDWCLSRNRYWGTPLNVWMCECGHYKTIGSIKELVELSGCDESIELHKPYIDEVTIKCEKCGKTMKRESEVIDVWYDSGAMPFAQFHYPFENKEEFEKRYPANFIFEGYDQTRGWFYSLEAINTALFNAPPMKNCLANGMICDSNGLKMSKSLGNYTDPMVFIKKYGGDTVRFMFYSNGQPYNDVIFSESLLIDCQKRFLNVLFNNYSFYVLYAEIYGFSGGKKTVDEVELSVLDRYILSKLNKLIKSVSEKVSAYMATEASRELMDFGDELSNWYIRRSRRRFWREEESTDKEAAFVTLYTVLSTFVKLCAPFVPFISEDIYQNIERPFVANSQESVHLCAYPVADEKYINDELDSLMEKTYKYCELGRGARSLANMKIRQPLQKIYINDTNSSDTLDEVYLNIIKDELNIKEIIENTDITTFVHYTLKPQLKTLGPKYNKLIGQIREYLTNAENALEIIQTVKAGKVWTVNLGGTDVEFSETDLLISTQEKEGFVSNNDGQYSVILDTNLNDELISEGYCREFISRVQNLRKTSEFEVLDRITIEVSGPDAICDIILSNSKIIMSELLGVSLVNGSSGDVKEEFELGKDKVEVAISKVK